MPLSPHKILLGFSPSCDKNGLRVTRDDVVLVQSAWAARTHAAETQFSMLSSAEKEAMCTRPVISAQKMHGGDGG